MGFNCLKTTKSLRRDSLLFTTQSPEVPGTHLIDLRRMKRCSLPCGFEPKTPGLGNQQPNYFALESNNRVNIIRSTFILCALLPISQLDKILQWLF